MNPVIWAAGRGHTNVVVELLNAGGNPDSRDKVITRFYFRNVSWEGGRLKYELYFVCNIARIRQKNNERGAAFVNLKKVFSLKKPKILTFFIYYLKFPFSIEKLNTYDGQWETLS